MLHPDKTKILFFSNTSNGEGVQINCNNNNDDLLNPDLIKQLSPITSNDDIPAAKFLGVYFDPYRNNCYRASKPSRLWLYSTSFHGRGNCQYT